MECMVKTTGDSPSNFDGILYKPCNDALSFIREDNNLQNIFILMNKQLKT